MAETADLRSPEASLATDESPTGSDRETDSFEDAVDTASVLSLTGRKASTLKPVRPTGSDSHATTEAPSSPVEVEKTNGHAERPVEPVNEVETEEGANDRETEAVTENSATEEKIVEEEHDDDADRKSIRMSDRLSHGSLEVVSLDENVGPEKEQAQEEQPATAMEPSKKLSLNNIRGSLPSMPWSPPSSESPSKDSPGTQSTANFAPVQAPATAPTEKPPAPAPMSRKLTSPFSWLSRNSQKEPVTSPTATSPRRNTASSIATLTSNPEMMLSKLEEGDETGSARYGRRGSARNSLKDRFKLVRMREEAGITMPEISDEDVKSQGSNLNRSSLGLMSPTGEAGTDTLPPASPIPPSPNPALAPGTVSGLSAGPSAMPDAHVDWDLWQSVVYEGPAAVVRTSPEELNRAIATGIPNVIRGVVWQVLAQSKNEDLELVYRDLTARGTEKDKDRNSNGTSLSVSSNGNLSVDKETLASSASSIHSDHSNTNGSKSPPSEKDTESMLRAQALAAVERKKKEREDTVMIQKLEKVIKRDLGARTSYSKHVAAAGLQDGLFGVCKAYALFDEGVGYAQGMNFLIMPLLFNMPEEEAFCLLVRLMNQYKLRDLFIQDMPGLHLALYQFERLLEDSEPALYCHLHRRGISGHLYATQWFLTLFAYRFPLQLVLRIYDLIFSEGLSAILRFGIVLMQKNASTLLGMSDMAQLTTYLKDKLFDVYIDQAPSAGSILENGFFGSTSSNIDKEIYRADQFVHDACEIKVTPGLLKAYSNEWEEKTRAEKEREKEIEDLRQSNQSYAIKQRKLEERIQACDTEQASMANELVRTKIENEELKDENESYKGQVKELRIVIEKQPVEIEEAWKLERDDLMQRNTKVHEENQRLEKDKSDLEEQLIQAKMRYAEINSAHETLLRKWTDLKRHMA